MIQKRSGTASQPALPGRWTQPKPMASRLHPICHQLLPCTLTQHQFLVRTYASHRMGEPHQYILATAAQVNILAVGITNQRETMLLWDRQTGKALHNAIVWLDTRTAGICERMAAELEGGSVSRRHWSPCPCAAYQ
jgi:FGGY family of carbohydrate kinases, N-terminal domain